MTIKQQGGIFGRNPEFNTVGSSEVTISKDTGAASPDPAELIIASTTNASGWSTTDPWGRVNFYSEDTSGSGPKTAVALDVISLNATAGAHYASIKAYNGASLVDVAQFSSTGDVTLPNGSLILANGEGIDFSATSGTGTSELFDDYEEGTWTPAGNGITLSSASGTYTKIGDTVHAYFGIVFPTTLDIGNAQISGLPFTAGTSIRNGAALGFVVDSGTAYSLLAYNSVIQIYNRSGVLTTNANNSAKQYYGVLIYKAA